MDFTTLAFNPLSRMNEIVRYSSVYQETNENLSEHITDVSVMAYLIAKHIEKITDGKDKLDIGVLLEKCLFHDADEVITGDIPRNTKYATTSAHDELNKVADEAIDMVQSMLEIDLREIWCNSKDGKEGIILKICDMLVVVKKAIVEIELRGNLSFLKVVTELEGHLTKMLESLKQGYGSSPFPDDDNAFSEKSITYLTDLVAQAKDEVTTIRVKYSHVIKKYMIKENVIKGE